MNQRTARARALYAAGALIEDQIGHDWLWEVFGDLSDDERVKVEKELHNIAERLFDRWHKLEKGSS